MLRDSSLGEETVSLVLDYGVGAGTGPLMEGYLCYDFDPITN